MKIFKLALSHWKRVVFLSKNAKNTLWKLGFFPNDPTKSPFGGKCTKTILFLILLIHILVVSFFAQNDLEKLVSTEKAFAQKAAEENTKTAFLEFSTEDGILFNPAPVNVKELWNSRPVPTSLLAWTPEFADISANGVLGYTTGPWEFRPKGKTDVPAGFGHFVTLWQKQPDGNFKFVLDVGINHSQIPLATKWDSPKISVKKNIENPPIASKAVSLFFETAEKKGLQKAYQMFISENIRLFRQNKIPFIGKTDVLAEINKNPSKIKVAKRTIFISAQDLAYLSSPYSFLDKSGKEIEKGNFLQIWKLHDGKWQLVLDLFIPLPKE